MEKEFSEFIKAKEEAKEEAKLKKQASILTAGLAEKFERLVGEVRGAQGQGEQQQHHHQQQGEVAREVFPPALPAPPVAAAGLLDTASAVAQLLGLAAPGGLQAQWQQYAGAGGGHQQQPQGYQQQQGQPQPAMVDQRPQAEQLLQEVGPAAAPQVQGLPVPAGALSKAQVVLLSEVLNDKPSLRAGMTRAEATTEILRCLAVDREAKAASVFYEKHAGSAAPRRHRQKAAELVRLVADM